MKKVPTRIESWPINYDPKINYAGINARSVFIVDTDFCVDFNFREYLAKHVRIDSIESFHSHSFYDVIREMLELQTTKLLPRHSFETWEIDLKAQAYELAVGLYPHDYLYTSSMMRIVRAYNSLAERSSSTLGFAETPSNLVFYGITDSHSLEHIAQTVGIVDYKIVTHNTFTSDNLTFGDCIRGRRLSKQAGREELVRYFQTLFN